MNNSSSCVEPQNLVSLVLKPILILEFILGVPGNVFALWIFFCKSPWKACNVYLLCISMADFLLLIALPLHIDYYFRGEDWIFGETFCRFTLYIISVNSSASVAFMSILAVDRLYRILRPHHPICRMSVKQAIQLVVAVWVGVLLLRLPPALNLVLKSHQNSSKLICHSSLSWTLPSIEMRVYNFIQLLEVLIAFILMLSCLARVSHHVHGRQLKTHRRVKRAVRLLLVLVIMFVLCFLPSVISGIFLQVFSCSKYLLISLHASLALSYMNCALDPVIYCHTNAWFRDSLKEKANTFGLAKFQMSFKTSRRP